MISYFCLIFWVAASGHERTVNDFDWTYGVDPFQPVKVRLLGVIPSRKTTYLNKNGIIVKKRIATDYWQSDAIRQKDKS